MFKNNGYTNVDELLDAALKSSPDIALSDTFADVLAEKVERKFAWTNYLKEFLIYLSTFAGLTLVSATMAFIWYDINWQEWLNFSRINLVYIIGFKIILVFILFTDRVLLRYFMHKNLT